MHAYLGRRTGVTDAERAFEAAPGDRNNAQWIFGYRFLYRDNQPEPLLWRARLGALLLTAGVVLLVFAWARELFGTGGALFAASLITLDPNFLGIGRTLTDAHGVYKFLTVRPGIYPWKNHPNAWRPAHIHFSLFGRAFVQRLVTQMYFPDDPLFPFDPIFNSVTDAKARERMVCRFDLATTKPEWALGYVWDIVLRGSGATPGDPGHA